MKQLMMAVGDYTFEDVPVNKGLIGGKIIATNQKTGDQISRSYKVFHTGKTNKFEVLASLMYEIVPPESTDEEENKVEI